MDMSVCSTGYTGTITDSKTYQNSHIGDIANLNLTKIPFKPWKAGSDWQYCTQKKYVGGGYGLFKKIKWTKYFHLSVYPSISAFHEMETRIKNPRTLLHAWVGSRKCGCGKTFRPRFDNQTDCVTCVAHARSLLLQENQRLKEQQQNTSNDLNVVKQKLNTLKRSHDEICKDRDIIRNEVVNAKKKK